VQDRLGDGEFPHVMQKSGLANDFNSVVESINSSALPLLISKTTSQSDCYLQYCKYITNKKSFATYKNGDDDVTTLARSITRFSSSASRLVVPPLQNLR
jgi:hypothetical protein